MGKRKRRKKKKPEETETEEMKNMEPEDTPPEDGNLGNPETGDAPPTEENIPEPDLPVEKKPPEEQKRIVRCPVCDGSGMEQEQKDGVTVCKCEDCGLLFRNPRPSLGILAEQRNKAFQNAMSSSHGKKIREQSRIAVDIMKAYHHLTSGRPAALNAFGKKVLDVNCGLGLRLREFQKYGWDVYGIDTSANAVQYAKACALDAQQEFLDAVPFKDGMFDLVLFWDNFGDLGDPVEAVEVLSRILKSSGLLYVHLGEPSESEQLFCFDPDSLRRVFMQNRFTAILENEDDQGYFFWFRKKEA